MSLIVVGSANMDLVVRAPRFPAAGETILGSSFATYPGGKGANQAVAAGKLTRDVRFVGCVGDDTFGRSLRESLSDSSVDVSALDTHPHLPTGIAMITVDDQGQNTIVVAPGANASVTASAALRSIGEGDTLLLQLEIPLPTVTEILKRSRASNKILNPAPACELPLEIYPLIDVITPNETEAQFLTGVSVTDQEGARLAAEELLRRGVRHVIVTLGAQGCFYASAEVQRHYPAMAVKTIDTVAAGDAFNGALAAELKRGEEMDGAIRFATAAAALSTTSAGAQASMPRSAEVVLALSFADESALAQPQPHDAG